MNFLLLLAELFLITHFTYHGFHTFAEKSIMMDVITLIIQDLVNQCSDARSQLALHRGMVFFQFILGLSANETRIDARRLTVYLSEDNAREIWSYCSFYVPILQCEIITSHIQSDEVLKHFPPLQSAVCSTAILRKSIR